MGKLFWYSVSFACVCIILGVIECIPAISMAARRASGEKHRVTLYPPGQQPVVWISAGQVSYDDVNYCCFKDVKTQRLITIRGTVVVEEIDKATNQETP